MAITELQPWAMLANGPPWMNAGLFSSVCTRLGISASLSRTVIGPARLEVGRGHRAPLAGVADDDLAEALLEVGKVLGEAEDRHHLRGDRDVEAVLAREAVGDAAERADDLAQRAIVHVHHPAPGDPARVEAELVAPVEVVVDQRGEQVVGGADRVEIAGEVEVDVLHRHDLGVAAAGRPALHAEAGAERGLAQADRRALADPVEAVAEADGGGGLAFAGRRRGDRGDQHELAVRPLAELLEIVEAHLGLVAAVWRQRIAGDAEAGRRPR